jgi:hypothetical protein
MSDYLSRKVTLPGGREIEIVYLGDVRPDTVAAARDGEMTHELGEMVDAALSALDREPPELWRCGDCPGHMVRPIAIEPADGGMFHIERTCPECDWRAEGLHTPEEVEAYHDALEDGAEEMLSALRTMARLNMRDDIDRMIAAIRDDLIQPMDF